jgi:hypothetical protein
MTNLTTKLACATVYLLLLCTSSQGQGLSDQQVSRVKELIHDTVQPSLDAINKKIDALVDAIGEIRLKPEGSLQLEREAADYKTEPTTHAESKYPEPRVTYINCCRSRWDNCCRPRWNHCCRPRWNHCCRPHWNHCCRPHWDYYCRPRGDDP